MTDADVDDGDRDEMHLLIQADIDGELRAAEAARVGAHTVRCVSCATLQDRLLTLSARIREEVPIYSASASLRARLAAAKLRGLKRVEQALAALPVELRECLVLSELEGCSYKEIAHVTGTPIGIVMSRLWRARQALMGLSKGSGP